MNGPKPVPKPEDLVANLAAMCELPVEALTALLQQALEEMAQGEARKGQLQTVVTFASVRLATAHVQAQAPQRDDPDNNIWIDITEGSRITGFEPKWFHQHWRKLLQPLGIASKPLGASRKGIRLHKQKLLKWVATTPGAEAARGIALRRPQRRRAAAARKDEAVRPLTS